MFPFRIYIWYIFPPESEVFRGLENSTNILKDEVKECEEELSRFIADIDKVERKWKSPLEESALKVKDLPIEKIKKLK